MKNQNKHLDQSNYSFTLLKFKVVDNHRIKIIIVFTGIAYSLPLLVNNSLSFLLKSPDYQCKIGQKHTKCNAEQYCQLQQSNSNYHINYSNYITDFSLHCYDHSFIASFGTAFFIGQFLGSSVQLFSSILGLYRIILIGYSVMIVSKFIELYTTTPQILIICFFLNGISGPLYSLIFTYFVEIVNPQKIKKYGTIIACVQSGSSIYISLILGITGSWRNLAKVQLFIYIVLAFSVWYFLCQTPSWYDQKKRVKESKQAELKLSEFLGEKCRGVGKQIQPSKVTTVKDQQNKQRNDQTSPKTARKCIQFPILYLLFGFINFGKGMSIKLINANILMLGIFDGIMAVIGQFIGLLMNKYSEKVIILTMTSINMIGTIFILASDYLEKLFNLQLSGGYLLSVGMISLSLPASYHQINLLYHKYYRIEQKPLFGFVTTLLSRCGGLISVWLVEYLKIYTFIVFGVVGMCGAYLVSKIRVKRVE